jgi:hypothetical protein
MTTEETTATGGATALARHIDETGGDMPIRILQRTLKVLATRDRSPRRCIPHGGQHRCRAGARRQRELSRSVAAYGGFPDGLKVVDGHITMAEHPGIGFEGKSDLYAELRALAA